MIIHIGNNSQEIVSTNYFDTEHAAKGLFYVSTNAGCVRLLVPEIMEAAITDMKTAKYVIMSRGPWPAQNRDDGVEILFEDFSDTPYAIFIGVEQIDMLPDGEGEWGFAIWTEEGKQFECPLKYRHVKKIPCLKGWEDNKDL